MKKKILRLTQSLTAALLAALTFSPPGWAIDTASFPVSPGTAHIVSLGEGDFGWDAIFDAKGQLRAGSGISQAVFMMDDVSAGSKIDMTALADGSSTMVRNNTIIPADEDIGNAYVVSAPDSGGKTIFFGGTELISAGDGHMTLEFNKDPIGLGRGGYTIGLPWEMTGSRTQGDILLRLNFAGGRLASANVSRWVGEADAGSYQPAGTVDGEGCSEGGLLCAVSNEKDIQAGLWLNRDPNGDPATVLAHHFIEFKINAEALIGKSPVYASICAMTSKDVAFGYLTKGGN